MLAFGNANNCCWRSNNRGAIIQRFPFPPLVASVALLTMAVIARQSIVSIEQIVFVLTTSSSFSAMRCASPAESSQRHHQTHGPATRRMGSW